MTELSPSGGSEVYAACDDARPHVVLPSSPRDNYFFEIFRATFGWLFFCGLQTVLSMEYQAETFFL